jgi:deoxyribonucleoside regulator
MSDFDLMVRVARLYYELGETQERIGELLGITRTQISRILKQARDEGIVEIRIIDESEADPATALEIEERFGVSAVHLAPRLAGPGDLTLRVVGRLAARILRERIQPDQVVGLGGGSTITAMVDEMEPPPYPRSITAVPLAGGYGSPVNVPVRKFAEVMGGYAQEIPAPSVVGDPATRAALMEHLGVQNIVRMWDRLDVAVFGVGTSSVSPTWYGAEAAQRLTRRRPAGDILVRYFDLQGRFVDEDMEDRLIGLHPRRLRGVPTSIAVATGDEKVIPLLGALRGSLIKELVTDRGTAEQILELDRAAAGSGVRDLDVREEVVSE